MIKVRVRTSLGFPSSVKSSFALEDKLHGTMSPIVLLRVVHYGHRNTSWYMQVLCRRAF